MQKPLSNFAIEILEQLFIKGPTWDGNVISKTGRDELVEFGFAERWNGWQWLTRSGIELAVTSDISIQRHKEWARKVSGN